MKKNLRFIGFTLVLVAMSTFNVYAAGEATCKGVLGDPAQKNSVAWYLQEALEIIRFIGIILCIVLTCMDIFKTIVTDEKADTKPIVTKAMKRLMYVAILFFLPSLVNLIMGFVGAYSTCGIS